MLKKISASVLFLALGILSLALPARSGNIPERIIPDSARWVAHLDMEKFVATSFFDSLKKTGRLEIKDRDLSRMLKIDWFKDITGLTVFGPGSGGNKAVFLVAGRFDKSRFLNMLNLSDDPKEIPYAGNTIYTAGGADEFGAFVNDGLIVFGESQGDIEKVLDTASGKAKNFSASGLNQTFKSLSSGAFLSAVLEDLAGLDKGLKESKFLDKAKGLFFIAGENQNMLRVRLELTADTPESAKNLADVAQGLIAMARLNQNEGKDARLAFLTKDARVNLEGKVIRLELNLPARETADLMSHGRGIAGLFD